VCDLERPRDVSRDMFEVDISGMSPARFRLVLPVARYEPFERAMGEGGHILSGRVVWNVNSTTSGTRSAKPRIPPSGARLIYAGPAVSAVADDPEGLRVLREAIGLWERLPDSQRPRVHLASLPMADAAENATIVNALQRHASVIVQKSLAEGFGLTVAEAMRKGRPVVARERVRDEFTSPRSLLDYLTVIKHLLAWSAVRAAT
jgi:hypothetical protein